MTGFHDTASPSLSPSLAPSLSPTRYPTITNPYDTYFSIIYKLSVFSQQIIEIWANDFMHVTDNMRLLIERAYVERIDLSYQNFDLQLININQSGILELANDKALLMTMTKYAQNGGFFISSEMQCHKSDCNQIFKQFRDADIKYYFEMDATKAIDSYFKQQDTPTDANDDENVNNTKLALSFSVLSFSEPKELYPDDGTDIATIVWIIVAIGILSSVICIIGIACGLYYRKRQRDKLALLLKTIKIKNPMVITIAIGLYEKSTSNSDFETPFTNLYGVRIDIDKALNLFGIVGLKYEIFPEVYYEQDVDSYKAYWREDEILELLKGKAEDLEKNLDQNEEGSPDRYDGLLVMISCHGIERYIVTSDYQKISKTAIHRIFSADKPLNRKIPRIFLFDCCSGSGERIQIGERRHMMMMNQVQKLIIKSNQKV